MKIKFQRSGGFGNIGVNVELDSANMTEEASAQLSDLVNKAIPFQPDADAAVVADGCNYELKIEDDGKDTELRLNDGQLSDDIAELFDFLLEQD